MSGRRGCLFVISAPSGSGKTTIARMLVGLEPPTGGRMLLNGKELSARPSRPERQARGRFIQIVQQHAQAVGHTLAALGIGCGLGQQQCRQRGVGIEGRDRAFMQLVARQLDRVFNFAGH